jgi:drug/metabolite transporter (DMT)-like permease
MFVAHLGEFAALTVAVFWTITALSFSSAAKRVGSLSVNLIRLLLGFVFLGLFNLVIQGHFFPVEASWHNWIWLSLSGFVGFFLGDMLLFRSYLLIPARISMLVMAMAPLIAAITGWICFHEIMSFKSIMAMLVTLVGIALVILEKKDSGEEGFPKLIMNDYTKVKFAYPLSGILYALGGAAGQGIGIVLSRFGLGRYNAFAGTQIRIIPAIICFFFLMMFLKRWTALLGAVKNIRAMRSLTIGSFFGPFLGVSFSLIAVQYTSSGIASTIMAIVPVLIILPSVLFLHEKVTLKEIVGAMISVAGVFLFFL